MLVVNNTNQLLHGIWGKNLALLYWNFSWSLLCYYINYISKLFLCDCASVNSKHFKHLDKFMLIAMTNQVVWHNLVICFINQFFITYSLKTWNSFLIPSAHRNSTGCISPRIMGVKLAAYRLDALRTGYAHPCSAKQKNIMIHHMMSCEVIEFDTCALI